MAAGILLGDFDIPGVWQGQSQLPTTPLDMATGQQSFVPRSLVLWSLKGTHMPLPN